MVTVDPRWTIGRANLDGTRVAFRPDRCKPCSAAWADLVGWKAPALVEALLRDSMPRAGAVHCLNAKMVNPAGVRRRVAHVWLWCVRAFSQARVLSACPRAPWALRRDRRVRTQARVPVLVSAHARGGLRLRPAVVDQEEAAPLADHRRRPALPPRPPGSGAPTTRSARPSANSPARPRSPTRARCATSTPPKRRRWARARHWGAHQRSPQRAKPRGRPQAPDVCASLRQPLAPNPTIPHSRRPDKTAAEAPPSADSPRPITSGPLAESLRTPQNAPTSSRTAPEARNLPRPAPHADPQRNPHAP
jgi:hypothetical protein